MRHLITGGATLALIAVAACSGMDSDTGTSTGGTPMATGAPAELALFGDGYPNPGDRCRRAGESALTNQYLDDAADLVACPPGSDAGLFVIPMGATRVAQVEGWTLYSVPRR
ncbi:hypothetical protein PVT71_11745 [Salipiger sp. H15]|uniref:Lipoprotein n=1 Tax=Alloyangia sp. H15 TaxID=3029062 RepID=A0AAU8AFC5_9RHOB